MTKKSESTKKFLNAIRSNCNGNGRWRSSFSILKTKEFLESFTTKELKEIFSDNYWVRYPSRCYSRAESERIYGPIIENIVYYVIKFNLPQKEIIFSHSAGLILKYAISNAPVDVKHKLLKRAATSRDSRVRKQAAKLLTIKSAINLLKDPDSSIRCAVKSRLLNEPKYIHLLDDGKDPWYLAQAYPAFKLSRDRILSDIEKYNTPRPNKAYYHHFANQRILANLLSRLSDQDLLFYMNINNPDSSDEVKNLFSVRLGG